MKIPKTARTLEIENPFRPSVGLEPEHLICKITVDHLPLAHSHEFCVRVDASFVSDFVSEMKSVIPKSDRYRCKDFEVWFTTEEWLKEVVRLARIYFDEIQFEDKVNNKFYAEGGF